jgi:hypothetical protein
MSAQNPRYWLNSGGQTLMYPPKFPVNATAGKVQYYFTEREKAPTMVQIVPFRKSTSVLVEVASGILAHYCEAWSRKWNPLDQAAFNTVV